MGIGNYFMNTNVDLFHDSTKNSSGILTSESNEMGLSTIFNYNGNNVAFIKTSYGILINATDMARPYNKRPVDYLRQIYVNELVSTIVSQTHISEDQLVIKMRGSSENGGGTWLYEDVAIDFAQWLDVKFKVWCNSKIKELLTTGLVKLPNFNNPPEAARAWADEYEARMKAEKEARLALEAKEKSETDRAFVTLCFSMGQSQRNTTSKPNGAEVQLPPRYSRNGCRFLAKRFCFCVLRCFT